MRLRASSLGMVLATAQVGRYPAALALDHSNQRVVVAYNGTVHFGGNDASGIAILHATAGAVLQRIILGIELIDVAVDETTQHAFVVDVGPINRFEPHRGEYAQPGTVFTLDLPTGTVLNAATVGREPMAIAIDPGSAHVFVVNQADDTVSGLDATTGTKLFDTRVGSQPIYAAVAGGQLFVANNADGSVTLLDVQSGEVVRTVRFGQSPGCLLVDEATDSVVVSDPVGGSIGVLHAETGEVLSKVPMRMGVGYLALDRPTGRLFVVREGRQQGEISVLERSPRVPYDRVVCTVPIREWARLITLDDTTGCVYVGHPASGVITIMDAEAPCGPHALLNQVQLNGVLSDVAVSPRTGRVFVAGHVRHVKDQQTDGETGVVWMLDAGHGASQRDAMTECDEGGAAQGRAPS